MKYKAVLFDLDGTLLSLDQDTFVKVYFKALSAYMEKYGYDPKEYLDTVMRSTFAMKANDGSRKNDEIFWELYCNTYGDDAAKDEPVLEQFYLTDFQSVKSVTSADPLAAETVGKLRAAGVPVTVATNPMFPMVAVESRIRWAELDPADFEMITAYDMMSYCKPDPNYYIEVCRMLGVAPEDCIMIGNDVDEDMIAETVGMDVFLLTDNLLNRNGKDISHYPQGGFGELMEYLGI